MPIECLAAGTLLSLTRNKEARLLPRLSAVRALSCGCAVIPVPWLEVAQRTITTRVYRLHHEIHRHIDRRNRLVPVTQMNRSDTVWTTAA